jgi:hypothetical protein
MEARDARPDDLSLGLGHERARLRMARDELQVEAAVAPTLEQQRARDRSDVGWRHRSDRWQLHRAIVAGSSSIIG